MREIKIGTKNYTIVLAIDEQGPGNANHTYQIRDVMGVYERSLATINFQKGPIKENRVNGVYNEDLIAIVIDRLEGFQAGDYACRENAITITKLKEALMWLKKRTAERES